LIAALPLLLCVGCRHKQALPLVSVAPETGARDANSAVNAIASPTISCTANPSTIKPGESATIIVTALSPHNRPLTYTYSATAGSIHGNGTTARFDSVGVPAGPVLITCTAVDDYNQKVSVSTSVNILAPYLAMVPQTQALCSINFANDKQHPTRLDNEAKVCLDEIALNLQKQPDTKLMLVNESDLAFRSSRKGRHAKGIEDVAAERAIHVKDYLVTEKGIDPSRIAVVTGTMEGQSVDSFLVPAGASFSTDLQGTTHLNESKVETPQPEPNKTLRSLGNQARTESTSEVAKSEAISANQAACTGFAFFTFPSLVDLKPGRGNPPRFNLYITSGTAQSESVQATLSHLCQFASNCIEQSQLDMDCASRSETGRTISDPKTASTIREWPILQVMPKSICADLSGFSASLPLSNGEQQNRCYPVSALNELPIAWNPDVKNNSETATQVSLALRVTSQDANTILAKQVDLNLKPVGWFEQKVNAIKDNPLLNLIATIVGILGGISGAVTAAWKNRERILSWFRRSSGGNREAAAVAPSASPAPAMAFHPLDHAEPGKEPLAPPPAPGARPKD
jgi:hypothetical protein